MHQDDIAPFTREQFEYLKRRAERKGEMEGDHEVKALVVDQTDLEVTRAEALKLLQEHATITVTTPEEAVACGDLLRQIKAAANKIDAKEKEATKPLKAAADAVRGYFKGTKEMLATLEQKCKRAILDFDALRRRAQEEEDAKARKAAEARKVTLIEAAEEAYEEGDEEGGDRLLTKVDQVTPDKAEKIEGVPLAGSSVKTIGKFRVTDFAKLPDDYKLPNETLLGQIARQPVERPKPEIPGIEWYREPVISTRAS